MEEIRLLGNLETRRGKMMQIILAGQPELDRKLEEREYRQLKQRIALRCHLRPFDAAETSQPLVDANRHYGLPGIVEQTVFPPDVLSRKSIATHRRSRA